MSVEIRPATPEDELAVRAVVHTACAIYLTRMDRPPAPMLADYGRLIAEGCVTAAVSDGVVVGVLVAYPRGDHLHVETVAVAPERQGGGIGRELMATAEDAARERGLAGVELYTNAVMMEALPFYAALAYEVAGRGEEDGYDRIFFRKKL